MSALRVYLKWVNSVISDTGHQVDGLTDLQSGEIICQILDILTPGQNLYRDQQSQPERTRPATYYLDKTLLHLQSHGIKLTLTSEDIYKGDIKSLLDLIWAIILNYNIHSPKKRAEKRTLRNGKRLTLRWCQKQQPLGSWDLLKSITNNLCSHDNLIKLLETFCTGPVTNTEDKEQRISQLLDQIENKYKIKGDLISPKSIVDATIEDHDLLIYLTLLRWRVGDTLDAFSSDEENTSTDKLTSGLSTNRRFGSLTRLDTLKDQDISLSHMLKTLASENVPNKYFHAKIGDRKNVTFVPQSENTNSKQTSRLQRPSSAPSCRQRPEECKTTPGRLARSFSPSRYAKSFEIPPEKKEELDSRTVKINGLTPQIITTPPEGDMSDCNGFSENTSDWLSSDMDSVSNNGIHQALDSTDNKGHLQDAISLKIREVDLGCIGDLSESEKSSHPKKQGVSGNRYDINVADPHRNVAPNKPPVGGIPMFGMSPGVPMMSGIGGGVPLFLLPGHNPQVAQLLQVLQQQQLARQNITDTTDGMISTGDMSQFELSGQTSDADYTDYSNLVDDTSLSESRGKFEKRHSQDSSEAELKQLDYSSPKENNPYSLLRDTQSISSQRFTDSGCDSQTRGDFLEEVRIQEDDSLSKIRLLRESLQKPSVQEKSTAREISSVLESPSRRAASNSGKTSTRQTPESWSQRSEATNPWSSNKEPISEDPRYSNRNTKLDPDLVCHLTDELKYLKSKVLSLERSQENSGSGDGDESTRFERGRPPKGFPRRSPSNSPPRSLLNSTDFNYLSTTEASKRARDTVSDLLVTMQSPVSRKQKEDLDTIDRSRSDLSSRPLLSYHGFGRSQSEDRFLGRSSPSAGSDWRSRSFHGSLERKHTQDPLDARSRSLQDLSSKGIRTGILTEDELIVKPPIAAHIGYGYSSPIKKVSSDIWGMDLNDLDNLEPGRQERWKRMTEPKKFMTDSEVIELKQCLASATMENEILNAKVANANLEIGEKMTKMAEVLEETKLSLIKTQSENETLRTQLDRERQRSDTLEVRVTDLESTLNKTQLENQRLGNELQEANSLLAGTNSDGIHYVEQENYQLKRQLHLAREEQKKNTQEFESLKVSRNRAHSAVKDLHHKLEDTREENDFLNREIDDVKSQESSYRKTASLLSRAQEIKNSFVERDNYRSKLSHLEPDFRAEKLYSPSQGAQYYSTSTPYSKLKNSEPLMTSSPARGCFVPRAVSPTEISPVKSYPSRPSKYDYEEISPAVAAYREIYPHRRPKSTGIRQSDTFIQETSLPEHRPRKWSLTKQLNYSDYELGDNKAEKTYSEGRLEGRPPHGDTSQSSTSSRSARNFRQQANRSYSDQIERLKSHLSRSYRSEENLLDPRSRYEAHSSLPIFEAEQDNSYISKHVSVEKGRHYNDFTPHNSSQVRIPSPGRCHAPVRGILKPSVSDQDLRRIGRSSPPSRRSASPNVTFNTEVSSRAISPPVTTSSRFRGDSQLGGVPLFGVPPRHYGVVRNLNDEFEDEEPVRDNGIQSIQGFRAKSWLETKNRPEAALINHDQRLYADLLIDKYLYRVRPSRYLDV